ncbi:hypothetical protein OROMI_003253 [Orobanche minor]
MEITNYENWRRSTRLEKGKNLFDAVNLSSSSYGQKRYVGVVRRCLDPDFDLEGEAKVFIHPKFLKKWNFYYDESNRNFHGKTTYWNDFDVTQIILNKLTVVQRDLSMETFFGQFLDLKPPKIFSSLCSTFGDY